MSAITRLSTKDADFNDRLRGLLAFEATQDERVETAVSEILTAVRARGDQALLEYTARFDRLHVGDDRKEVGDDENEDAGATCRCRSL